MKKSTTIDIWKCDACGKEFKPFSTSVVHSYFGTDVTNKVIFNPVLYAPYATSKGDLCKECIIEAMKKYIRQEEAL